jgi:hypothetical protein
MIEQMQADHLIPLWLVMPATHLWRAAMNAKVMLQDATRHSAAAVLPSHESRRESRANLAVAHDMDNKTATRANGILTRQKCAPPPFESHGLAAAQLRVGITRVGITRGRSKHQAALSASSEKLASSIMLRESVLRASHSPWLASSTQIASYGDRCPVLTDRVVLRALLPMMAGRSRATSSANPPRTLRTMPAQFDPPGAFRPT